MLKPILILGAGRSGTKLIRSILGSHENISCIPFEINYIWRFGNARFPTDQLTPDEARPEVANYVRNRFRRFSRSRNRRVVAEKTCANSLRVPFVKALFPEALVVHVVRDGRAVAESARRCWLAAPSASYLLKKAAWVPLRDLPFYLLRYCRFQVERFYSRDRVPASWGPRFEGLDTLVRTMSLIEVCGLQWSACVDSAAQAIERMSAHEAITIRYEDLVADPLGKCTELFSFLQLDFAPECRNFTKDTVLTSNVAKWKEELTSEEKGLLNGHLKGQLQKLGYSA